MKVHDNFLLTMDNKALRCQPVEPEQNFKNHGHERQKRGLRWEQRGGVLGEIEKDKII
jgi:hypothetical protein